MGRKETVVVILICSFTTALKICSVVALYHAKSHDRAQEEQVSLLSKHTLHDDVLLAQDPVAEINPERENSFKQTLIA